MTERHTWVPYVAVVAGALLLLKAVLIIGSGNEISEGAMAVLYLGGLLLGLAAAVGAGLRQRKGRRTLVGAGAAFGLLLFVMVLTDGLAGLFSVFSDAEWVADEGPIGLLGVILLALGARAHSARSDGPALVGAAT